jgi:hypothetical protein
MKLRIKGNSLRLRVTPSEMTRLMETGRIEETIQFGAGADARLTYALERGAEGRDLSLCYRPGEVTVALSNDAAQAWAEGEQVGISADLAVGEATLAILVEKDFACLDRSHAQNEDTYPNPHKGQTC